MTKKQFFEFLLKFLNFFLTLSGLSMVGYGLYRLINWHQASIESHSNKAKLDLVRRVLLSVHQSKDSDKLPSAWFLFLFVAIGAILFVISCFGCLGTAARSRCCLCFYAAFMAGLVLTEIGLAAFVFFHHNWEEHIPTDKTGNFHSIYNFLHSHWKIIKWVALAAVILEVMALLLALYVRAMNRTSYDSSDDEIIVHPGFQRPHVEQKGTPATGKPSTVGNEGMSRI
ncbi:hypothetical protein HHK36_019856 [Tetracentron sinense]|uniref:Uncharacterized protein n=1 Tax=Tetracentron sinense TaxID=13715 RepID=A0A834Z237_TETSI|nr:hypothetical protein HHK36_019856 [Tetracentron sinense]